MFVGHLQLIQRQSSDFGTLTNGEVANGTSTSINTALEDIFEKMLAKSIAQKEYKMVLGIAIDALRLDVVEDVLSKSSGEEKLALISYVLICSNNI